MTDHRPNLPESLRAFKTKPLREATLHLLHTLGYQSDKTIASKSHPRNLVERLLAVATARIPTER